jgi:hypothetical protein
MRCGKTYMPGDLDFCDECDSLITNFLSPKPGTTEQFFKTAIAINF